jgi:hypothetical protein
MFTQQSVEKSMMMRKNKLQDSRLKSAFFKKTAVLV